MHGTDPHDEIAYWRERAKAAEEQIEAVRHELGNEKQVSADLREEHKALRFGIISIATSYFSRRNEDREVWAIRQAANYLTVPFSNESVQAHFDKTPTIEKLMSVVEAAQAWRDREYEQLDSWTHADNLADAIDTLRRGAKP